MKVCVFFAEGFEEIEAITVVDLLRRAEVEVLTVSITDSLKVVGVHGIPVLADIIFEKVDFSQVGMLVLPGGIPGTPNLAKHFGLIDKILKYNKAKKEIAAICAAPTILGVMGLLEGKRAVCYPGKEDQLKNAIVTNNMVESDENITTSRGVGTAIPFSLRLIERLKDKKTAQAIKEAIVYGEECK